MKLFSADQIKEKKDFDTKREILRTQEMEKVASKARKEMANSEADFKNMLAGQKERWAQEEKDHEIWVTEREKEISILEKKKAQAMIPIEIFQKEAEEKMELAEKKIQEIEIKEEELEGLKEKLEDRLDEVGEKENGIDEESKILIARKKGIDTQQEQVNQSSKMLSNQMSGFAAFKSREEANIKEIRTALFLKERSLLSKEESLKRTEEALKEQEILVNDQRATLEREFKRLGLPH